MNGGICGDNRFEIIGKAKQAILEETNIKDDKAQMAELDSFLFRCWQMGWLKKYEEKESNEGQALLYAVEKTAEITKREMIEKACEWLCKNMTDSAYLGANTLLSFHKVEFIERFKKAMEEKL